MSVNEELHEHAEHAKEPFDKRVAATMAIIAALLAVVAVFGQILVAEELLSQQKASDQWTYYQAKSIRRYESDIAKDMFKSLKNEDMGTLAEKYTANVEKYQKDGEEIQKQARELEEESHRAGHKALRMHIGEIFLEMGIVFASLAILTKREQIWMMSIAAALLGAGAAVSTYWVS